MTTETTEAATTTEVTTETSTEFAVPEAYVEKGFSANVKSVDDLWSQLDGAQALIGKKSIPANDATDEQLQEFYTQIRPEAHDKYELSLPEGVEVEINQEEQDAYKKFFHDNGFSQKQAQALFQFHIQNEMGKAPTGEQLELQKSEQKREFNAKMEEKYGSKSELTLKNTLAHALEVSQETQDVLANLPNDSLLAVVDMITHMDSKIIKRAEDGAPEQGTIAPSTSLEDMVTKANILRQEASKADAFSPEYREKREQLKALDDKIEAAFK